MPPDDTALLFHHPSRRVRRTELRHFLRELTERVAGGRGVTCLITTDREVRALNRKFRGQDRATDVLSFPVQVPSRVRKNGNSQPISRQRSTRKQPDPVAKLEAVPIFPLGEIAISFDRAASQASEFGHPVEDELRILMLHGVLHLAGMNHETDSGAMARTEVRWRRRLGLPPSLMERAHA